jgi:hypothetical protein
MPGWRFHLTVGLILSIILIYTSFSFGYGFLFIEGRALQYFFIFHVGFITLLGSLAPDFDYKRTRIRNALGPVLGIFIVISFLYINRSELGDVDPTFVMVLLIVFITVPFLAGIAIPFKHHGKMHSITYALFYGLTWTGLEGFIFDMTYTQSAAIGIFGFLGYFSHLLMDRILKLI